MTLTNAFYVRLALIDMAIRARFLAREDHMTHVEGED